MRHTVALLVLSSSLFVACREPQGPHDPTYQTPGAENAQSPNRTGPFEASAAEPPPQTDTRDAGPATPAVVAPPAAASETLTDAHVIEVIRTANRGELEQAKIAQAKAKDAKVKKFAAMMTKDHGEANAKAESLATKAGMESRPSALSATLESDAKRTATELGALTGAELDKAYIGAQVKEHQAVLDAIDTKLMPAAQAPEVRSLLEAVKAKVAHHLAEAQAIQGTLK